MPHMLKGVVTKVGYMNKTATVSVYRWITHKRTGKRLERARKYLTHDPENRLQQNDSVLIRSCPPVSARKHFTLHQIISKSSAPSVSEGASDANRNDSRFTMATETDLTQPQNDISNGVPPGMA